MFVPDKSEVLELYNDSPRAFVHKVKRKWAKFYKKVKKKYDTDTSTEAIYLYFFDKSDRMCKLEECEDKCEFLDFTRGYREFCSNGCRGKYRTQKSVEIRVCEVCDEDFEVKKKSDKFLCSNKCKYEYQRIDSVKEKMVRKAVETQKKRYGGVGFASEELKEKTEETREEKYGDKEYTNREKFVKTMNEKHDGVGFQSEKIKEKAIETKKSQFYKDLMHGDRLRDYIKPNFSENEYLNSDYKDYFEFKCKKCGNIFEDRIKDGKVPRCFNCDPVYSGESADENGLFRFVKSILPEETKVNQNDRNVVEGNVEFDIFVPEYKIAIEYNGLYWHSELSGKDKKYHLNKTKKCENNDIQLIHIFENEWKHKRSIVEKRLKHILSSVESVFLEDCNVRVISDDIKKEFLENNHVLGNVLSEKSFGFFWNGDLKGILSFSEIGESGIELSRVCFSEFVIGDFGWTLEEIFENIDSDYQSVLLYLDRRYPQRIKFYQNAGFHFVGEVGPLFWHFENGYDKFLKSEKNLSIGKRLEKLKYISNSKVDDYNRVWDCGYFKFKYSMN